MFEGYLIHYVVVMKVVTTNIAMKVGSPKVATSWGCWASVNNPLINHAYVCLHTVAQAWCRPVTPTRWHGTWHGGRRNTLMGIDPEKVSNMQTTSSK